MHSMASSSPETGDYVLDSYALLAYFESDPEGNRVEELFEKAARQECRLYMSMVNLGEVLYIVERNRGLARAQETLARIDELPIHIVDADRPVTLAAAHIKAGCPIAYADCFAAALSQLKVATVVTGDREFRKIKQDCNVKVEWLSVE